MESAPPEHATSTSGGGGCSCEVPGEAEGAEVASREGV